MNVLFFPDNKLGAVVAPIFNGHAAIVSQNTDRLKDGKYALAEIACFKHNVQGTSFLNPFGATINGENSSYGETLQALNATGRISFGLYWRSDFWVNPQTDTQEQIPDYYVTKWTSAGVTAFKKAVLGATKAARYPNHGQQMYDMSDGQLGYDFVSKTFGSSGGRETLIHTQRQLDYFKSIANLNISSGSYTNGRPEGAKVLIPKMLFLRNSSYSFNGAGNIAYSTMGRFDMISKPSTTRVWDAVNEGRFATQAASIEYMKTEIQRAISAGGWFSDFLHWHSLYEVSDTAFFDPFFKGINDGIGSADVWRAGNDEAVEYFALKNGIDKIGSFIRNQKVYVCVRFNDAFSSSNTDGISNAINPALINTPLSIQIDFTGTGMAGKSITSDQALHCRNLGSNKWILNFELSKALKNNGYLLFEAKEGNSKQYDASVPVLTVNANTVTASKACKFVVWRKPKGSADTNYTAIHRTTELANSLYFGFSKTEYEYIVGAISRSRVSSVVTI